MNNAESPKEAKASKAGRRQHIIKKDVSYLQKKILSPSKRLHNDCLSDIVIKDDQEVDEEVMKNDDAGRKIEDEKFMKWGKGYVDYTFATCTSSISWKVNLLSHTRMGTKIITF